MSRAYRFVYGGTPSYGHTAADIGWGAGWPTDRSGSMSTVVVQTKLKGDTAGTRYWAEAGTQRLLVHTAIAPLWAILATEIQRRGYLFISGWCWSYENRPIGGTNSPSNHSWGLAVDVNAPLNPYTHPRVTNMPDWLPTLMARYGFAWGGDYTDTQDSMHYEFMGTPAQAVQALAAARAEITGAGGSGGGTGTETLEDWMVSNKAVVQDLLNTSAGGVKKYVLDALRKEGVSGASNNAKHALQAAQAAAKAATAAGSSVASLASSVAQLAQTVGAVSAKQDALQQSFVTVLDELYRRMARAEFNGVHAPDHDNASIQGVYKAVQDNTAALADTIAEAVAAKVAENLASQTTPEAPVVPATPADPAASTGETQ